MIHELGAIDIQERVQSGELSAIEVLEHMLARIDKYNDALNAVVFIDRDRARRAAEAVDAAVSSGKDPGPLAGVPLGVKELEPVEGWPDTSASTLFRDRIARVSSTQVQRLEAAGAIPVGLTASPEFGFVSFTVSLLHGVTRNPWNLALTPGGSSGGSAAALSAGLLTLATASDMGGSIRVPASFCGLVGVKGTFGLVSRAPRYVGMADLWCFGPLARSVLDAARYLDCVVGVDERDPASFDKPAGSFEAAARSLDLSRLRVAFVPDVGLGRAEPAVEAVVRAAFSELVASGVLQQRDDLSLKAPDSQATALPLMPLDQAPDVVSRMAEVFGNLSQTEGVRDIVATFASAGASMGPNSLFDAAKMRLEFNAQLADVFESVDLLIMPTTPMPPFAATGPMPLTINGVEVGLGACPAFTVPFNLSGHPVASVPAGLVGGVPVGLSIVGRRHRDDQVVAAARALEVTQPWPLLAPGYAQ